MYDIIIIGTGAGGATLSKNLSQKGHKILILEKGTKQKPGNYIKSIKTKPIKLKNNLTKENKKQYPFLKKPLELSYIEELGGTTIASIGNACFSCSGCYSNSIMDQFEKQNINLLPELLEAGENLKVKFFPKKYWGKTTKKIAQAGENLGYEVEPMPKFINFNKCINCGSCVQGCIANAKWEATQFINQALNNNTKLKTQFTVTEIIHENGKIKGVKGTNQNGKEEYYQSKIVILAAGAINTPIILKNSGFNNVGENLFFDMFTTIGGYLKDANLKHELLMGIKAEFGPYFLSPHYSTQLLPLIQEKGYNIKDTDIVGLMLKFADETQGQIQKDGTITKQLTKHDFEIIETGYDKAIKILTEMGVDNESIVATSLKGAHPGGTAALGKTVDKNFETKIKGLYISDASVIPEAPGRPPILTISAISNKVSKIVDANLT